MLECSTSRQVPHLLHDLHMTTAMAVVRYKLACIVTATHIHHAFDVHVQWMLVRPSVCYHIYPVRPLWHMCLPNILSPNNNIDNSVQASMYACKKQSSCLQVKKTVRMLTLLCLLVQAHICKKLYVHVLSERDVHLCREINTFLEHH